jgi:hypothetical protein
MRLYFKHFKDIFLQDYHPLPKFVEKKFFKNGYILGNHFLSIFTNEKGSEIFSISLPKKRFSYKDKLLSYSKIHIVYKVTAS